MFRTLVMAGVLALAGLGAQAATLKGAIFGTIGTGIDNTGADGLGLFGTPGSVLAGQGFEIGFTYDTLAIVAAAGGEQAGLTSLSLTIGGQVLNFGATGQVDLLPFDLIDAHYAVSMVQSVLTAGGSRDYGLLVRALIEPSPFSLTTKVPLSFAGAGDDLFQVIQRNSSGAETGRTSLLLQSEAIQIAAVPLPAGGLLLLSGLVVLGLQRKKKAALGAA